MIFLPHLKLLGKKSEHNPKNIKLKDWLSYHMTVIKSLEKKSLRYKVAKFVQE